MLVSVNGADLDYHIEGKGVPCFVPVLVGTPRYERTLSQALRRRFQFVFVATGRYDFLVPPHTWDSERGRFGDCTVRVFERSGHYPQYEEQAAFDAALLS